MSKQVRRYFCCLWAAVDLLSQGICLVLSQNCMMSNWYDRFYSSLLCSLVHCLFIYSFTHGAFMEHPVCTKYCDGDNQEYSRCQRGTSQRERWKIRSSVNSVVRVTRGLQRCSGSREQHMSTAFWGGAGEEGREGFQRRCHRSVILKDQKELARQMWGRVARKWGRADSPL